MIATSLAVVPGGDKTGGAPFVPSGSAPVATEPAGAPGFDVLFQQLTGGLLETVAQPGRGLGRVEEDVAAEPALAELTPASGDEPVHVGLAVSPMPALVDWAWTMPLTIDRALSSAGLADDTGPSPVDHRPMGDAGQPAAAAAPTWHVAVRVPIVAPAAQIVEPHTPALDGMPIAQTAGAVTDPVDVPGAPVVARTIPSPMPQRNGGAGEVTFTPTAAGDRSVPTAPAAGESPERAPVADAVDLVPARPTDAEPAERVAPLVDRVSNVRPQVGPPLGRQHTREHRADDGPTVPVPARLSHDQAAIAPASPDAVPHVPTRAPAAMLGLAPTRRQAPLAGEGVGFVAPSAPSSSGHGATGPMPSGVGPSVTGAPAPFAGDPRGEGADVGGRPTPMTPPERPSVGTVFRLIEPPAVRSEHEASHADTRAEAAPAPRSLDGPLGDAVHSQIVRSIRMQWTGGLGEARVTLRPEYLGDVVASIAVERGVVTATLHADTPEVRAWIDAHAGSLRDALVEHGLRLDQLTVAEPEAERATRDPQGRSRGRGAPPPPRSRRRRDETSDATFNPTPE